MAKLVLGRNLGELLHDRAKKSGDPFAPETAPIGSGVRSLMRGHAPAAAAPASVPIQATASPSISKTGVPPWYLFAADILLTAIAMAVVLKSHHPLSWQRQLFCAAAVALGACLAVGAVLQSEENHFKS